NWNKKSEDPMNVVDAIKRSCNTWFYVVGRNTGSDAVLATARNLGFGSPVGLPFQGENAGSIPDNAAHRKKFGFPIRGGDLANISIGQGAVTATPLQVARAMAAIGTGNFLTELRLVRQIQDINNDVVRTVPEPVRLPLQVSEGNLDIVRKGMVAVVSGSGGTGKKAAIPQAQVAGKTGTAQWDIANKRNLAWFAGFVPATNPRFAFAAVYEGNPGEKVGGGSKAAPIVGAFLKEYLTQKNLAKMEARSSEIAARDRNLLASVSLGTGTIYQGAGSPEDVDEGFEINPDDRRRALRPRSSDPNSGGLFRGLFRKRR
ncbi:MAG: penicillin-binding transpeptidase domain-containing protein, partial [Verrucomicrobiota bacterium]